MVMGVQSPDYRWDPAFRTLAVTAGTLSVLAACAAAASRGGDRRRRPRTVPPTRRTRAPRRAPSAPGSDQVAGRNAVLDKGWGAPTITKDGKTTDLYDATDPQGSAYIDQHPEHQNLLEPSLVNEDRDA